jgi:hypothetical protein
MDLTQFEKKSDTVVVELHNPVDFTPLVRNDGTPMTVEVYGKFSDKYKQVQNSQQNARLKRAQRSGGKVPVTAQELRAERLNLVVTCVKDWNIVLDGETPPCTPDSVKSVFDRLPWVMDQVEEAMEDTQAFLKS